jgi:hypothetical protein
MKTQEFLLGDVWFQGCFHHLNSTGLSVPEMVEEVRRWERAVVKYTAWLLCEGFGYDDVAWMVYQALNQANYDLKRFPIVP